MLKKTFTIRNADELADHHLQSRGVHPLLARLWSSRGVRDAPVDHQPWNDLLPPTSLAGISAAAQRLALGLKNRERMLIVGDYDCDGATATAVGLRALRAMGAAVDYLVPNRFETGYGLSPAVVELAAHHPRLGKPQILITVDNGIASLDGVAAANARGIDVIITDHHLPGDTLPDALAIVNPNQPGCGFGSKNLAGVGVMFYLMLHLRTHLRSSGEFGTRSEPHLASLLDLVALGTVADVVRLDANNRLLVQQGMRRMRQGLMQPGLAALFAVSQRDPAQANTFDLGFALGPRLNAAGRLADMSLGIECLTTDDPARAMTLANTLDQMNRERRQIEVGMREAAFTQLAEQPDPARGASLCVFDPNWHQGVIGLVASRLKDRYWRPTLAFAPGSEDEIKGSGRSIPDVHLRDALDLVSKRAPGLLRKFGGHAMAAGVTLARNDYARFTAAFESAVRELTGRSHFDQTLETDGSLESSYVHPDVVSLLESQVWGAGFPAPVFLDEFEVHDQRLVGDRHLKLRLKRAGQSYNAIWFGHTDSLGSRIQMAYRLNLNNFQGIPRVELVVEHADSA